MITTASALSPAVGGGSSTAKLGKIDKNYEDFLLLLTTQLQNQDPSEPTDTNQLTQQIATLSQVEQQLNTNKNLEKLISMYSATQYNSIISYIGKQVEAEGNVSELKSGSAPFAYYLGAEAEQVNVTIKDRSGGVVFTGNGTKIAGRNVFNWNGRNNQGQQMPDGTYAIEIAAKDASGNDINSKTFITGVVTSVDSIDGSAYLSIGDIAIPLEKITSIRLAPSGAQG